jgi:hypothetical protein
MFNNVLINKNINCIARSRKMSQLISIDEVCHLLEALDEWEEVALHLGLSDQTIKEIRGLSGGNRLRREAMVLKWIQREELEPSWSTLEKALVSANQEPHAAKIRAWSSTPTNPGISATTAMNLDDLKEASDCEKGTELSPPYTCRYSLHAGSRLRACTWLIYRAQLFLFHIQKLKHFSLPLTTRHLVRQYFIISWAILGFFLRGF